LKELSFITDFYRIYFIGVYTINQSVLDSLKAIDAQ
jgi:hypothetical protein